MGRKRLECQSVDSLFSLVSSMLVPSRVLEDFEIWDAHEYRERRVIEMREKEGRIPSELSEYGDAVFDGYYNPLETPGHSFVCKPVCLRLFRRRYRHSNSDEHYSNGYGVTLKGVRTVPESGFF
ncbi:MAG: hypothetical protein LBT83_05880 [Tannerella sp.]|nr:hypothetical protein [Tannerella sp.]